MSGPIERRLDALIASVADFREQCREWQKDLAVTRNIAEVTRESIAEAVAQRILEDPDRRLSSPPAAAPSVGQGATVEQRIVELRGEIREKFAAVKKLICDRTPLMPGGQALRTDIQKPLATPDQMQVILESAIHEAEDNWVALLSDMVAQIPDRVVRRVLIDKSVPIWPEGVKLAPGEVKVKTNDRGYVLADLSRSVGTLKEVPVAKLAGEVDLSTRALRDINKHAVKVQGAIAKSLAKERSEMFRTFERLVGRVTETKAEIARLADRLEDVREVAAEKPEFPPPREIAAGILERKMEGDVVSGSIEEALRMIRNLDARLREMTAEIGKLRTKLEG